MKRQLFILTFLTIQTFIYGQRNVVPDSVTIIIENVGSVQFKEYLAVVKGQLIGGQDLQPGQSARFKISLSNSNVYRFVIYLDKNHKEKYSIEPMDYFAQVSDMQIIGGSYKYIIGLDNKEGGLSIKLVQVN
jgi:hypothetical protein